MRAPVEIDHPRQSLALLAWFTAASFFFYAWVLRVAPSVMVEELMRDFAPVAPVNYSDLVLVVHPNVAATLAHVFPAGPPPTMTSLVMGRG